MNPYPWMMRVMHRGYNFGAGPAMLPEEVLCEAQQELLNWQGLDMSVMEVGHRTAAYQDLMHEAQTLLRQLLLIPSSHHVLFLGGAARLQFSMIPLNFIHDKKEGGYLVTGLWSSMAYKEACHVKQAYCLASSEANDFLSVPQPEEYRLKNDTAYIYYTPNETVDGIRCQAPNVPDIPLIADMTSCLLSEPIHCSDYALIFAGAQKNIANAGLTIVIIRDDLLKQIQASHLPTMLDYRTHITHQSLYATPPTFNCYIALKVFQWIEKQGGVDALYAINQEKANRLYRFIDTSSFYQCPIEQSARSLMNVCFSLCSPQWEALFLKEAQTHRLYALQGHRTKGGLRASLYNAMPLEGVDALIDFMDDFAKRYSV